MNPAWDESDAYAETIIADDDSNIDYNEGGFLSPLPSPPVYDRWAEQALQESFADQMRARIVNVTSQVPAVECKLDGRRYNLWWVVGSEGKDLLQAYPDRYIQSVCWSDPSNTYQVDAHPSIKHFEGVAWVARPGSHQITWAGSPSFEQSNCGYSVNLEGVQDGIGPMEWTLTLSQGEEPTRGGWNYRHRVPADVIMEEITLEGIEPTRYFRAGDGKTFDLWVVSDEGHNLLESLEGCKNISIKISSQSRTDDESKKTLKTFAAYARKYERNMQGAFRKYWTGDDHVSRQNNVDTTTIKLKGYQPGENLLGWTINAPEQVWPGWYEKHMVEITYSLASGTGARVRRTAKAAVTLEPVEHDVD